MECTFQKARDLICFGCCQEHCHKWMNVLWVLLSLCYCSMESLRFSPASTGQDEHAASGAQLSFLWKALFIISNYKEGREVDNKEQEMHVWLLSDFSAMPLKTYHWLFIWQYGRQIMTLEMCTCLNPWNLWISCYNRRSRMQMADHKITKVSWFISVVRG